MASYFIFTFFIFIFQRINPFLIISFKINKIDDCIRKIELVDNAILYEKTSEYCHTDGIDTYYDIPLPEIPKTDDTDQRLSKVIVPPDVASKNAEQGNSPGGAGTPATYNNLGSNMGSGGNMQITINVNGKIEGMTPDNQSQIVAAVIAQVNQTNFRQQISNGFIRTPNR